MLRATLLTHEVDVYTHACIDTRVFIYILSFIGIYIYICLYMCVYIHIYIYDYALGYWHGNP